MSSIVTKVTSFPPMSDGDKDENKYQGDCAGWSFVDNKNRTEDEDGHGTHVSGIITTILRDHSEKIKILPIKVFAANEGKQNIPGLAPLNQRLLKAFEYAIERKVDVIHLSVGWPKSYMTVDLEEMIKKSSEDGYCDCCSCWK
jgi:subtilisin